MNMIHRFMGCIREYKKPTILTLLCMVGEVAIEVLIPFFTANLVNEIKGGAELSGVVRVGLGLILMSLVSLGCVFLGVLYVSRSSTGLAKNVLHDVFTRVQSFAFENIDKFSSASLVTRMTTDINNVQMSFMMCIRIAVRAPLMFLFAVIMAYIMGGALATTFLIIIPVLVIGLLLIARKAMPAFRAVFRKYDKLNESVEENVRAMRVVKGFAREGYEKQKFAAASHDIAKDFTFAERVVALNAPLMQFCVYFNMIFVLFVGSRIIITNGGTTIDVGQLSAMLTYGMQILMSLMMISMIYVMMTMSYESFVRICEVLEEEPALTDPASPAMDVKDGSIDFENVSFKYSAQAKKFALQDINLHIDSGMTVGILGGTGSGKSTLVHLLDRLYDLQEGRITIGGVDLRDMHPSELRRGVGVVLQEPFLFSRTIEENIGICGADRETVRKAAATACIASDIEQIANGYDTMVGERGVTLSGGQKQRVAIARMLTKKTPVMACDDSLSAVDTQTDEHIREALNRDLTGTTSIIISHRITTLMDCDNILVLEYGKVLQRGTPQQLLQQPGLFRQIYDMQMSIGEEEPA